MKFFLVFLSVLVFTYAGPLTFGKGKSVTVDDDGTITILSENGNKIFIPKAIGHPGPKDVEITVDGPLGMTKKIHIDSETNTRTFDLLDQEDKLNEEDRDKRSSIKTTKTSKNQKSETEVLSQIFKEYQNVVDEKSRSNFVAKIDSLVQSGELNLAVYDVLRSLDQYKFVEKYGYQGSSVNRAQYPVGTQIQYPVGNQIQYPVGNQDQYSVGYQGQYPVGNQGQYPVGNQGQYPVGYQGQYQYGNQVQYPVVNSEQYPAVERQGWNYYGQQAQQQQSVYNPWLAWKRQFESPLLRPITPAVNVVDY